MQRLVLNIIDRDTRRRAELTSLLNGGEVRVEPYEDADELAAYWPSGGILLVRDDGCNVATVTAALDRSGRWMPVVAHSERPPVEKVVAALALGALDYCAWPATRDAVIAQLARVSERAAAIADQQRAIAEARVKVELLSERERQVLRDLAHGLSNKEIAARLGISPRTVEIHRAHVITRIGARSSAQAIRIAVQAEID